MDESRQRAKALLKLSTQKADPFPMLLEALEDSHFRIRGAAWEGMVRRDPARALATVLERADSPDPDRRQAAFRALALAADPVWGEEFHQNYIRDCLALMEKATGDPDPRVRERALTAFLVGLPLSEVAREASLKGLDDEDGEVVDTSLRLLEQMGPEAPASAVPGVRRLLSGPHAYQAVTTLGALGPLAAEAVGDLRRLLNDEEKGVAAQAALEAIEPGFPPGLGGRKGGERLGFPPETGEWSLEDQDENRRAAAVRALGADLDRLLVCLADPSHRVREAAATALAGLAGEAVAELVAQGELGALRTLAESARRADFLPALQAQALPLAREQMGSASKRRRVGAISLLVSLECADAELFRRALDDSEERVVELAIYALQRMGPRAALAVPRLIELLDVSVHNVDAAKALGAIGDPAALPHLRKRLKGGDQAFCSEARAAIESIQG